MNGAGTLPITTTPTPNMPPWVLALSGLAPFAQLIPNPLAATAAGVLLAYGPEALASLIALMHNPAPTQEDWLSLLQKASAKTYDQYLAEAKAAAGKP